MEAQLRTLYKVVKQHSDLFFSVDKDLDDLPRKRRRVESPQEKPKKEGRPMASTGYGELTLGGFAKLINYMANECPAELRIDSESGFLDVGSGFGKCVLHAKLASPVARSVGMELVPKRNQIANECFAKAKLALPLVDWSGVELLEKDATTFEEGFPPEFTHLYCFDKVFTDETMASLAPIYERTDFKVLACCTPLDRLNKFGCLRLELLRKIPAATTGQQTFTFFLYRKTTR